VIATLGPRWTARIIVVPSERPVTSGPYLYLPHPNHCIVAGEILVLPLMFGLIWYDIVFSVLNLYLLCMRISTENSALSRRVHR
jgi:methyltransferase